jgi:hypothetical protein
MFQKVVQRSNCYLEKKYDKVNKSELKEKGNSWLHSGIGIIALVKSDIYFW